MAKASQEETEDTSITGSETPVCGVVRPIAELGDYPAAHWVDVHSIIADAVDHAGYRARLVSDSDATGVILSEIVSNLYNDPIVICDVSGKNSNVMFELGMRLAFEKPTIIIKDDLTPFSFDISPVKHLVYPRTLRYQSILDFKDDLTKAIIATVEAAQKPDHRGYLQQFGPIAVTQLAEQSLSLDAFAEELRDTQRLLRAFRPLRGSSALANRRDFMPDLNIRFDVVGRSEIMQSPSFRGQVQFIIDQFKSVVDSRLKLSDSGRLIIELGFVGEKENLKDFIQNFVFMIENLVGVDRVSHYDS